MNTMRCLVACVGLAMVMPEAAMAQDRSTLDAQLPRDHEYVVAIWFLKKDKAGSFHYRIMDPSIPRNYDRRAWEDFKTRFTNRNVGGEVRFVTVKTAQDSRQTERQQVMARVQKERDRIEFQDPEFEDVKPEKTEKSKQEPKKDSEKAKKAPEVGSVAGTVWEGTVRFFEGGAVWNKVYTFKKGSTANSGTVVYRSASTDKRRDDNGTWTQTGDTVRMRFKAEYHTQTGTIRGEVMEIKASNTSGDTWNWTMRMRKP